MSDVPYYGSRGSLGYKKLCTPLWSYENYHHRMICYWQKHLTWQVIAIWEVKRFLQGETGCLVIGDTASGVQKSQTESNEPHNCSWEPFQQPWGTSGSSFPSPSQSRTVLDQEYSLAGGKKRRNGMEGYSGLDLGYFSVFSLKLEGSVFVSSRLSLSSFLMMSCCYCLKIIFHWQWDLIELLILFPSYPSHRNLNDTI